MVNSSTLNAITPSFSRIQQRDVVRAITSIAKGVAGFCQVIDDAAGLQRLATCRIRAGRLSRRHLNPTSCDGRGSDLPRQPELVHLVSSFIVIRRLSDGVEFVRTTSRYLCRDEFLVPRSRNLAFFAHENSLRLSILELNRASSRIGAIVWYSRCRR